MEPFSRPVASRLRSQLTLKKACLWAAALTGLLFLVLNRNGCWFYRNEPKDLVLFVFVFAWLVTFLSLATIWRVVLLVSTVIVLVPLVGMRGIPEMNAAPEAAAVHALRDLTLELRQTEQGMFPEKVPTLELSPLAQKLYRFEYIPIRSQDGEIRSYIIEASPCRRGCDLDRSFTITSDNKIFWTREARPATPSDILLDQ